MMRNFDFFVFFIVALFAASPISAQTFNIQAEDTSAIDTMHLRQEKMKRGSEVTGQRMASDEANSSAKLPLYIDNDPVFQRWVASVEPTQKITLELSGVGRDATNTDWIRSIGGNRARSGQLKQVTALLLRNNRPVCSATAISRKHFLTAAHCFCGPPQPVKIAFGVDTRGNFTRSFGTSFQLVEGARDMNCANYQTLRQTVAGSDLAVIELKDEVGELYIDSPANLPLDAEIDSIELGTIAIIAGYGRRSMNPGSRKHRIGIKNYLLSPIVDVSCDRSRYDCVSGREIISRDTRNGGVGPCSGDSGGAMFVKSERRGKSIYILIAVVSRMARSDLQCGDAVAFTLLSPQNLSQVAKILKN